MSVPSAPDRENPLIDAALRELWRKDLRRRIAAAGIAFDPAPSRCDFSLAPDLPSDLAGWTRNPVIWDGAHDHGAIDNGLAGPARAFAAAAGIDPAAAVAHPITGMALPLVHDNTSRAALMTGRPTPSLAAFGLFVPPDRQARASRWINADLRAAARDLAQRHFSVLRGLLTPGHLAAIRAYVRGLRHGGLMRRGDSQVPRRHVIYDEPVMHGLHGLLTPLVARVVGTAVRPTYAYLATYLDGADLPAHLDRPQCRWNMSLALDQTPDLRLEETWPIYVQPEDRAIAIHLMPGDAVIYSGTDIVHGRRPLPEGQTATLCFFHFVEPGFEGRMR